ncbi:MAG: FKBP-type peptidyl-prolyl cis-trans isomerase, partial [Deltaproteobacteria bacterium]
LSTKRGKRMPVGNGNKVRFHYSLSLCDGSIWETSVDEDPMELTVGQQHLWPGVDEALIGMETGQLKTTTLGADMIYGSIGEGMALRLATEQFPAGTVPQLGQELFLASAEGQSIPMRVTDASATSVTLDRTHPLAGKELVLQIHLLEIL